jgi:hypothetical protein
VKKGITDKILRTVLFLALLVAGLNAQEKQTPPPKPEPGVRAPEVAQPRVESSMQHSSVQGRQRSELPKIDLPEFVITGTATIDLPATMKMPSDQNAIDMPVALADPLAARRDRATVEFAGSGKFAQDSAGPVAQYGNVLASVGTHFTPMVWLWLGQQRPEYFYLGDAHYASSKGYLPYTNRSEGALEVKAGTVVHATSLWLDGAAGTGNAGYGSETYRFFGSSLPSLTRSITRFRLGGELASSGESPLPYDVGLGFSNVVATDSSADVTEVRFDLNAETSIPVWSTSLLGRVRFSAASLTGSSSASLPYLEVMIGSRRLAWKQFFTQVSANAYLAKGMLGQRLAKIYPNAMIGYRFPAQTVVSLSYTGGVRYNALSDLLRAQPYLSGVSPVLHSDIPVDVTGAAETNWNEVWRTRLSVRYQKIRDYPSYTEPGGGGIWWTSYQGTSSVTTYQADVFANVESNSYFALTAAWNVTKNSATQLTIPYVPELQTTAMYARTVVPGLSVSPWLSFVGRRSVDLSGGQKLPAYLIMGLKADYSGLGAAHLFVDVQNATDKKYEEWRGYRAAPFLVSVGMSYHW